ncbi:hypothetical protein V8C42DRAFT_311396 [Trichoderma barbatum]
MPGSSTRAGLLLVLFLVLVLGQTEDAQGSPQRLRSPHRDEEAWRWGSQFCVFRRCWGRTLRSAGATQVAVGAIQLAALYHGLDKNIKPYGIVLQRCPRYLQRVLCLTWLHRRWQPKNPAIFQPQDQDCTRIL